MSNRDQEITVNPARVELIQKIVRHELSIHSGPLPAPEVLEHYERILPGAAERILAMAEAQSSHRMGLEKQTVKTRNANSRVGMWMAYTLSAGTIAAGIALTMMGRDVAGLTTLITAIASLVGMFIYNQHTGAKERDAKRAAMEREMEQAKDQQKKLPNNEP